MADKDWLIYSRKDRHRAACAVWYYHDFNGYTNDIMRAGRYTEEEAKQHCESCHGEIVAVHIDTALGRRILVSSDEVEKAIERQAEPDREEIFGKDGGKPTLEEIENMVKSNQNIRLEPDGRVTKPKSK